MLHAFLDMFGGVVFRQALHGIWITFPIWLPIVSFSIFAQTYMRYIRAKYISEQATVLLELRLPKEMLKSPAAMEIVLQSLSQPSVGTYLDVYLKGRIRPWFSLELVSLEGQVKFFIWTQKKFKNIIETQIYSQFPTVEVFEVPDYALTMIYDPSRISMFGTQFKLTKADAYPIKTYIDYGMDKDPKEEFKIDPMTPVIEFLGSLKKGEYAGFQILIQANKKLGLKDAHLTQKPDWKGGAKKAIEEVLKDAVIKPEKDKGPTLQSLSDIQKETINAIQRNVNKVAFDTMIRAMYWAEKDSFNAVNIGGLTGSFKQYSSGNLNGFAPNFTTGYDYPWQDFRGRRKTEGERKIFDAYKRRSFFNPPYKNFKGKPFVLTVEELATIFHFPGGVSATPTFSRIVSKKGEAPANLPL
jgi:hypothetical protein